MNKTTTKKSALYEYPKKLAGKQMYLKTEGGRSRRQKNDDTRRRTRKNLSVHTLNAFRAIKQVCCSVVWWTSISACTEVQSNSKSHSHHVHNDLQPTSSPGRLYQAPIVLIRAALGSPCNHGHRLRSSCRRWSPRGGLAGSLRDRLRDVHYQL